LIAADGWVLVQERLHRLIVVKKVEQERDWNACSGEHGEAACFIRISFDQFVEVHDGNVPLSPQKRLGLASADPTWPPYQATRTVFSIYDFAITLYDDSSLKIRLRQNAQLRLPQ